jgi:hypothetical protein
MAWGMNPKKKNEMRHPKTPKHSYLWTPPNEMENLKLSGKTRLQKEVKVESLPLIYYESLPLIYYQDH